jgi:aarF domain-containing kinase
MKSTFTSRSLKLLSLATAVGRKELSQNLRENFARGVDEIASGRLKTRVEQARIIAEQLSQLKGAAMKAGQLLSLDAGDLLPPEAIEVLAKLQSQAEPIEWREIEKVLKTELNKEKLSQIENLSQKAAAAASIGQVHKARIAGRDVAIKIQYPGVRESVDSDLKLLKNVAQLFISITGKSFDLDSVFEEFARVLKQEANYKNEADVMLEYGQMIAPYEQFAIPEPILSHTTERVLTLTWQNGKSVNEWLKSNPPQAERNQIGAWLLDLYTLEFYKWGLVQTDPNFGNFLVQTDPLKLVVLDFGATLRYPVEFRRRYVDLLRTVRTGDHDAIVKSFVEFGWLDPRESDESQRLLIEMLSVGIEPFAAELQPFDFSNADYAKRTRETTQAFATSLKYSAPPREILFLHRKLGGIFNFLKKMEARVNLAPYWNHPNWTI